MGSSRPVGAIAIDWRPAKIERIGTLRGMVADSPHLNATDGDHEFASGVSCHVEQSEGRVVFKCGSDKSSPTGRRA